MSEITIRPYRPGDEHGILAGHKQVFPASSLAHWQWKYRDNPTGRIHTMVAEHEAEGIVGAYMTLPNHYLIEDKQRLVGQCVDIWVLPQHRRATGGPGLFVNLSLAHYERWCGDGPERNSFLFGWTITAWKSGNRYLRFLPVRDWSFLFREVPPGGFPQRASSEDLVVRQVARFDQDTDALWAEFAKTTRLSCIRDARYLNWRYADAPETTYELLECRERRTGRLRGLTVMVRRDFVLPNTCFLVDWLAPADDLDATIALVAEAERRTGAHGAAVLATLFQHRDPRFLTFQKLGFLVFGTDYFKVVIQFDVHDRGFYANEWYHTLGDSDLV